MSAIIEEIKLVGFDYANDTNQASELKATEKVREKKRTQRWALKKYTGNLLADEEVFS